MAVPTVALFFAAGGWIGMACLATIWAISNFELEALNYLEHYGLIRVKDQPINYRHNWDNSTAFTAWFFIEIGRQAVLNMYGFCPSKDGDRTRKYTVRRLPTSHRRHRSKGQILGGVRLME